MPLFVCDNCHAIENTALGHYWTKGMTFNDTTQDHRALCSECMPSNSFKEGGKWHDKFPKTIATTEVIKEMGESNFVYVSDIQGVKATNACVGSTYPDRNKSIPIPKRKTIVVICTCGNKFKAKKTSICKICKSTIEITL
jgi:hypothetical protein